LAQTLKGVLDLGGAGRGVQLGFAGAVIPDQPIAFGGQCRCVADGVAVADLALLVGLLPQRPPADRALLQALAEGGVLAGPCCDRR
jgi:hypothetical protein